MPHYEPRRPRQTHHLMPFVRPFTRCGRLTRQIGLDASCDMLLLRLPNDIAAFAVFNGSPRQEFSEVYESFKRLYERTIAFGTN